MLDEAAKHHPNPWWWLKADGCDITSGLAESMRGVWTGDVDLNDGGLSNNTNPIKTVTQESQV